MLDGCFDGVLGGARNQGLGGCFGVLGGCMALGLGIKELNVEGLAERLMRRLIDMRLVIRQGNICGVAQSHLRRALLM